ncbi:hypothetical protein NIES4072_01610 [Nostoc commune NIES-4072]|uniref:DUF1036 domain-containing protein n=1 Tax=Nostoc commune NIES-4072 TaxID=2005467 RepID=A0A2R5FES3_NOSCO|nr:DUF1036 domain-containing protein [Nostoc commune]BBD66160.1 hypothetical protein NIES4070_25210 [Nostoc commune HK-02]GBG16515.1 hypothetical protein NIES4072_01610 [Nostoc commune NIES-4072]
MNLNKSCLFKLASVLTLTSALQITGFLIPTEPIAHAAERNGPVKLCNGDVREDTVTAAIMYYSFEKNGWIAQGWYNIAPGKCAYVLNYRGAMFVYGKTSSTVYSSSGNTGFCGPVSDGFYGYQKTKCRRNEKFYQGIEIAVPSDGGGFNFTFGDPDLVRDI